jgi:hypothetical protein
MPFATHTLVSLSWLLAFSPALSVTETPGDATASRARGQVRSPDPEIRQLVSLTTLHSATFAGLVSCVQDAQVFVYIVPAAHLRRGLSAALQLATAAAGSVRYLRIFVRPGADPAQRVASLAHELAHVCEAARAGALVSNAALADYFRSHTVQGEGASRVVYETVAGHRAATAVLRELEENRLLAARTVDRSGLLSPLRVPEP